MNWKLILIVLLLIFQTTGYGQIPKTMTYQGVLSDATGEPLPDGNYSLTFRIYDTETDGSPLWSEAHLILAMNGIFNVILGEITPISLKFEHPYWLGIQVGTEPELTPRIRFTSAANSFKSIKADTTQTVTGPAGGDLAGNFMTPRVAGIQGNPVAATPPEEGQVLEWSHVTARWEPSEDSRAGLWQQNGDDVYREAGNIGIGKNTPSAILDIIPISSVSNDTFLIMQSNSGNSFFDMNRTTGVRDFITMRKAGNTVASIDGDGNITARSLQLNGGHISTGGSISTTAGGQFSRLNLDFDLAQNSTPDIGRLYANTLPVAYGHIASDGQIITNYGISQVTKTATGTYQIRLIGSFSVKPIVIANGVGATQDDEIITPRIGANNSTITFAIVNGEGERKDSTFGFVVFATRQ